MQGKILVVDDDQNQLKAFCLTLIQAGFSISTAANGIDAIKKVQSESPDLIVMDVMMPELDGFAVCETLRDNPSTASIPVLLMTGLCSHISRLAGLESGATDYITKPFDPEQLVSKVESMMCKRSVPPGTKAAQPSTNAQPSKHISISPP